MPGTPTPLVPLTPPDGTRWVYLPDAGRLLLVRLDDVVQPDGDVRRPQTVTPPGGTPAIVPRLVAPEASALVLWGRSALLRASRRAIARYWRRRALEAREARLVAIADLANRLR